MTLAIRCYEPRDEEAVIALWHDTGITRPWNDPRADIARKLSVQPELFLVGEDEGVLVATVMAGYDGHRGAVYYLAVSPTQRHRGHARALMAEVERLLTVRGCPKLNLSVRVDNEQAHCFYDRIGYARDPVVTRSKRLIAD
jgi:ribosomal protein S18 acetylase RimI-like enzyme